MGITISYRGQIKPEASIDALIEEIKDFSETLKWTYHILDTDLPKFDEKVEKSDGNLYGIVFAPPESELIWMTVLNNRKLAMSIRLDDFNLPYKEVDDNNYWCFTKTQFAGPEAHKAIVAILKYISQKYFSVFELNDEGKYWESGDENMLYQNFNKHSFIINSFAEGLEKTLQLPGESVEDAIRRIIKNLSDNL